MNILVTGGCGYIGSHACVELLEAGHDVVVVDNLVNSSAEPLRRIEAITGRSIGFVEADIADKKAMQSLFASYQFDGVMHFAGLKAVGESTSQPLSYYQNNITGSLVLFDVMQTAGVKKLIFSSSATVYGVPEAVPIHEQAGLEATNPYGRTKLFIESILKDIAAADSEWKVALLRYFNPVGAHESGNIGEDPSGIPNNLMPYIAQVAIGRRKQLSIFGNDYPTPDGTGIRDYIHVVDLAKGHLAALNRLNQSAGGEVLVTNLGTGQGYSVLEMVQAFERASGRAVPYEIVSRRDGDVAECWADPAYAKKLLGWQAVYGIDRMCEDAWRWQSQNPNGYQSE